MVSDVFIADFKQWIAGVVMISFFFPIFNYYQPYSYCCWGKKVESWTSELKIRPTYVMYLQYSVENWHFTFIAVNQLSDITL